MNDRPPIRDRTLILRILVPGLETRLRDKMNEAASQQQTRTPRNNNNKSPGGSTKATVLDLEGVRCVPTQERNGTAWKFHVDGATYPACLRNLPCPGEVHKTHDHAAYYKSADIAQMLIVFEDEMALEESLKQQESSNSTDNEFVSYHSSGLTSPTHKIVERSFTMREQKKTPPRAAVAVVEEELVQLLQQLAKDSNNNKPKKSSRGSANANKLPTLTAATKVLETVEEEVMDFEPWMSQAGQGVELNGEQQLHRPEVWLTPEDIKAIREKYAAKKKKKKKKDSSSPQTKAPSPKTINGEEDDQVNQIAASLCRTDGGMDDLDDDFDLDLDFNDLGFDVENLS